MNDQWSDILETYHLASCPAPDNPCTCRLCEVTEGITQLEERVRGLETELLEYKADLKATDEQVIQLEAELEAT